MEKTAVALLQKLIRIDSQNPPGNERKIICFIKTYLKKLGVASKIYEFKKNRLNLICNLASINAKRRIIFTPHVDTVPASGKWKFSPFSATIHNGRLYGRGATDCKVNVAVALFLIKRLKETKTILKNLDLIFAFTADEETGNHYGIMPLTRYFKNIDYGVVLDADEFDIIVAQKGLLHLRVEFFGKEAHGAYPERGVNAVEKGVLILQEILRRKLNYKAHALLKKPTLNIGRFSGGDKVNVVAGWAFFEIDIRYLPSMNDKDIIRDIEKIIKKHTIKYKIKIISHQAPIEIDTSIPTIKVLRNILKDNKIQSKLKPSFGATVINYLTDMGIESFAFGFGSKGNAHIKDECVKISNIKKGVKVLEEYVKGLDDYFD